MTARGRSEESGLRHLARAAAGPVVCAAVVIGLMSAWVATGGAGTITVNRTRILVTLAAIPMHSLTPGPADALALARATIAVSRANLIWAFGYNVIAIPLAALGYLNPLFAGIAMSASSLIVTANSLRLRRFRAARHPRDRDPGGPEQADAGPQARSALAQADQ